MPRSFVDAERRSGLAIGAAVFVSGGVLFSQDGHLPWVIDLLRDEKFWRDEVGAEPPRIEGLGKQKLVAIHRG